jgi:3-hydroxy-9,10-secoandrosta-1,3,5(10)-triene-9,17-dione monooxygenase reductase component
MPVSVAEQARKRIARDIVADIRRLDVQLKATLTSAGKRYSKRRVVAMSSGVVPSVGPVSYREVFSHLATGVTVVTSFGDPMIGMAANSVTSLSLDPPMLLFCPAVSSTTWPRIRASARFCVNVMAHGHEATCRRFAARGVEDRFAGVSWHERGTGPGLDEAVAWIECEIHSELPFGDHFIVVADVVGLDVRRDVSPLVFFQGVYGTFVRIPEPGLSSVGTGEPR